jgi:hypothetical protein
VSFLLLRYVQEEKNGNNPDIEDCVKKKKFSKYNASTSPAASD